jgi:hypothetical protein
MHVCPEADFRTEIAILPLGGDPTRSWECNEKRVDFDEHCYAHNGSVDDAVRPADDIGRTSNANAIVVVSRQGEHAHKSNSSIHFP